MTLRNRDFDTQLPEIAEDGEAQKYRFHYEFFRLAEIMGDVLAESSSAFIACYDSVLSLDKRIMDLLASLPPCLAKSCGSFEAIALRCMALHLRAMLHKPYIHLDEAPCTDKEGDVRMRTQVQDVAGEAIGLVCDASAELIQTASETALIGFMEGRLPWVVRHLEVASELLRAHSPATSFQLIRNAASALQQFRSSEYAKVVKKKVDGYVQELTPNFAAYASVPMDWQSAFGYPPDMSAFFPTAPLVWARQNMEAPSATVDPSLLMQVST